MVLFPSAYFDVVDGVGDGGFDGFEGDREEVGVADAG